VIVVVVQREKYAAAYDDLAKQGVPEYVVYVREKDSDDKEWRFVGSLAVPRNLKVDEVIFENEEGLVKVRARATCVMPSFACGMVIHRYSIAVSSSTTCLSLHRELSRCILC